MRTSKLTKRIFAWALTLALLLAAVPVQAIDLSRTLSLKFWDADGKQVDLRLDLPLYEEELAYEDDDVVRVTILLEEDSVMEAGYSTTQMAGNAAAMAYRHELEKGQDALVAALERDVLDGEKLDVVWNLTLAMNAISANVAYGRVKALRAARGVKSVTVETAVDPLTTAGTADPSMSTSVDMVGSGAAWAAGYTGAGTRIAIIDTGLDLDHQSFDPDALFHAYGLLAAAEGMEVADYVQSLDLLDADGIRAVMNELNILDCMTTGGWTPEDLAVNRKVPFAFNYIDMDADVTHDNDTQGGHGSHVAGIAAANRFIPDGEGGYTDALTSALVQGVAPDAQLLIMKVFGKNGGAFPTDYMAAMEDAILLGADSVNMSLGTVQGFARTEEFRDALERLMNSDTLLLVAVGNSGYWAEMNYDLGYLYAEDVNFCQTGTPAAYESTIGVGSVDNIGMTDYYVTVGDSLLFYTDATANNTHFSPMTTVAGEHEFLYVDSIGTAEEFAAAAELVAGRIAICNRGTINFTDKVANAVEAGAVAVIIVNNVDDGALYMDLASIDGTVPVASMTLACRDTLLGAAENKGEGLYLGSMTVSDKRTNSIVNPDGPYELSEFSSWGIGGALIMKPEVLAPGGNIYSVDGTGDGDDYVTISGTSMACPQVAGMMALLTEFIRDRGLTDGTDLSVRQLATAILMGTATPLTADYGYVSLLGQGAGVANIANAMSAGVYLVMDEGTTTGADDGKVKVELGADPQRLGVYEFGFTVHNLTDLAQTYLADAAVFVQAIFADEDGEVRLDTETALLEGVTVSFSSPSVTVAPNGETHVDVVITLSEEAKTYLDTYYPNGTYIQAFVELTPEATAEGRVFAPQSFPVLGFYGNWSDPNMFDHGDYTDNYYGADGKTPYTAVVGDGSLYNNYVSTIYPGGDFNDATPWAGNPYVEGDRLYPERAAIHSGAIIHDYAFAMIRNGGAVSMFIEKDGVVKLVGDFYTQVTGSYYNSATGLWNDTATNIYLNESPAHHGLKEGDVFTVGAVSVPEYYEMGGDLTPEQVEAMLAEGTLGKGVLQGLTFTVDDTAPELLEVVKDEEANTLTLTVRDNQYVAAVAVLNSTGTSTLSITDVAQSEAGETLTVTIDMSGLLIHKRCMIMVADYAGNEYLAEVDYAGDVTDYSGKLYGFSGIYGDRCFLIDPDTLEYSPEYEGGTSDVAQLPWQVTAAEFVGGYVYMATDEGELYVAEQGDWSAAIKAGEFREIGALRDMAYNYADGCLYGLDFHNNVYRIDTVSGEVTFAYTVDIDVTARGGEKNLLTLAIDGEGTFYSVNDGGRGTKAAMLYAWTEENVVNGAVTALAPVSGTSMGVYIRGYDYGSFGGTVIGGELTTTSPICYSSMAWDHQNDVLYLASAYNPLGVQNYLYTVDPVTGLATPANDQRWQEGHNFSCTNVGISGLYVVPSDYQPLPETTEALRVTLDRESLTLLPGAVYPLEANVYSWSLFDRSVTFASSNEAVVTVSESGEVTAVGVGTATVTATSVAAPHVTATCAVTVEETPAVSLSGLLYNAEGLPYWVNFSSNATEEWKNILNRPADRDYQGGTLMGDMIYAYDTEGHMYGLDADTFVATDYGYIDESWRWTDAAPAPLTAEGRFDRLVGIINGGCALGVINPPKATGIELAMESFFSHDPMATISLKGYAVYEDEDVSYEGYDYYVLTEGGMLYSILVYFDEFYEDYNCEVRRVGQTGLSLAGVADMNGQFYATAHYDLTTGYLFVASYSSLENADRVTLYALEPSVGAPAPLGSFGADNWPLVSLYQYTQITDLTVKIKPETATVHEGDTVTLTATVYPESAIPGVVWSSSDRTVATVDEHGVVTGVSAGTVTVTATSVMDGSVYATATVTVKPLFRPDMELGAHVTFADGRTEWVSFNLSDPEALTTLFVSDKNYEGAGVHDGKLYASDDYYYYELDPQTYAPTTASSVLQGLSFYDVSTLPARTVELYDAEGNPVVYNVAGKIMTVSPGEYMLYIPNLGNLNDPGNEAYLYMYSGYELVAVSYLGFTYQDYEGTYMATERYAVLGADGYLWELWVNYYVDEFGELAHTSSFGTLGQIDLSFSEWDSVDIHTVDDGENYGLIIADSAGDSVALYYYDLHAMELYKIGVLEDVADLCGLHTAAELSQTHECRFNQRNPHENYLASPATCTRAATYYFSCTCGEAGTETFTVGDPLGHDHSVWTTVKAPTCIEEGLEGSTCSRCRIRITRPLPTVDHEMGEWEVVKAPTCTAYGKDIRTCVHCDRMETRATAPLGHEMGEWVTVTPPTCTEAGEEARSCTRCDKTDTRATDPTGHEMGEWVTVTPPTCAEAGEEARSCAHCDETETRAMDPVDHSFGQWVTVKEPSCSRDGLADRECTVCGRKESKTLDADGVSHKFDQKKETKAPTCTEEGEVTYSCSYCDATRTESIPVDPKAHTPGEWVVDTEAAPGVAGHRHRPCAACGVTLEEEDIPALPLETEAETESPATQAPETETQAPETEAPATEASATEAPATETPATDESPATELVTLPEPEKGCKSAAMPLGILLLAAAALALGKKRKDSLAE